MNLTSSKDLTSRTSAILNGSNDVINAAARFDRTIVRTQRRRATEAYLIQSIRVVAVGFVRDQLPTYDLGKILGRTVNHILYYFHRMSSTPDNYNGEKNTPACSTATSEAKPKTAENKRPKSGRSSKADHSSTSFDTAIPVLSAYGYALGDTLGKGTQIKHTTFMLYEADASNVHLF